MIDRQTGGRSFVRTLLVGLRYSILIVVLGVCLGTLNNLRDASLELFSSWSPDYEERLDEIVIGTDDAWMMYVQKKAVFVDARSREMYSSGHLPGAINVLPGEAGRFADELRHIDENGIGMITYCDGVDCPLASRLAGEMMKMGITRVHVYAQGITGWVKDGYPVEFDEVQ